MIPVRQGDGVGLSAAGFSEVREGDGTVLWSQGGAIPDGLIDDFEHGDLANNGWGGATGSHEANTNSPVIEGDYSVKQTASVGAAQTFIKSSPGDGLANYPDLGDALSVYITSTDWSTNGVYCGAFGNDLAGGDAEGYTIRINSSTNVELFRVDSGANGSSLSGTSLSGGDTLSNNEFYEAIIKRDIDDSSLIAKLYSIDQTDRSRQTELASLTATDTTYQNADDTVFLGPTSSTGVASVWDFAYIPDSI